MVARFLGDAGQSEAMLKRFKELSARNKNPAGVDGQPPCS